MKDTIELTDEVPTLLNRLKWLTIKAGMCALATYGCYTGGMAGLEYVSQSASKGMAELRARFETVRIVEKYIQPAKMTLDTAIEQSSTKYKIPALLLRALVVQESGQGLRSDRVRYEPKLQSRFKRLPYQTDMEYQALASSWGYAQIIYGIHRQTCALESYADLLDPATNLDCAGKILSNCLLRRRVGSKSERFVACLKEYNGGDSYPGEVLDHLANLVLEQTL